MKYLHNMAFILREKSLMLQLIRVVGKIGGITISHAMHVFSPLPPAVLF